MILLHRIGDRANGSNFNSLEEILDSLGPISFDGIYSEVWRWRHELKGKGKDVTLFYSGKHIGTDNRWDAGQPPGYFISLEQLNILHKDFGFKLGYHSWSHRDLTKLTEFELIDELSPPFHRIEELEGGFAYPYGNVDARVAWHTQQAGYRCAWSVVQGDDSPFQLRREYLNW